MAKIEIDPAHVHLDHSGMKTRAWFVALPEEVSADMLTEPAIWRRVQDNRQTALMLHDAVFAVGFGNAFSVEARIIHADRSGATLALGKVNKIAARTTPLPFADDYRIIFVTGGYAVERVSDGVRMGNVFETVSGAERHMHAQRPQRVA